MVENDQALIEKVKNILRSKNNITLSDDLRKSLHEFIKDNNKPNTKTRKKKIVGYTNKTKKKCNKNLNRTRKNNRHRKKPGTRKIKY